MKKPELLLLTALLFLASSQVSKSQMILKTDKETYAIDGAYNFLVTKTDNLTKKVLFKVETKIPDKNKKEMFYPAANMADFTLVGENMVIVYDVWKKSSSTKDCSVKLLNCSNGKFSEAQLLYSTTLNSVYSSNEIKYQAIYSPDKSKLAVIKDNISPGYPIEPELNIYDTKTFAILSTKKISGKYEGQKRIFDLPSISMDDNGNIQLVFHLLNEKTKMTTKSYSANIPFAEKELKNIKELGGNASNDAGGNTASHGRFYKNFDDYLNDKPIKGVRIKNGSWSYSAFGGTDYKLIDDEGNLKKEDTKDLPSELFTYKRENYSDPFLMRIIDKKPYIVLCVGKLNYYALYLEQQDQFYAEGWNGELNKFKEKAFEEYLEQYNLLEDYKKDKPKREFKDDVNGYFNKIVAWRIKYFKKLNDKM